VSREKIVLRRNGVEAPKELPERGKFRSEYGIPADAKMILFLGRLSEKKSPDLLLRAFAMLPDFLEGKETRLVFSGPDEDGMRARLDELAKELNATRRVRIVEPIFNEAKWAAYRDADVFVLPSQNENFGNTAAEAAVAGTPVIVTETCGIAPLLSGIAGLVVAHDAQAIANALEKVLTQADLRVQLSAGRTKIADRLGWDEPAREMERLYEKLVATRSSGA
jgi:glycosyltransferase involved in cell wall biosynthesis